MVTREDAGGEAGNRLASLSIFFPFYNAAHTIGELVAKVA